MSALLERYGPRRVAAIAGAIVAALALIVVAVAVFAGGEGSPEAAAEPAPSATGTTTATPFPTPTPEASPTPIAHPAPLDGMPLSDEEWELRKGRLPLAVMIDNSPNAYPHAGLDRADLVYEAFVEGGITRFMAVYWRQDAEKILPVRSARTPFVIWVSELTAMYGHAGGAQTDNEADALGQIAEWGIADLNAFSPVSGNYYYRDSARSGPHDLASSTAYLLEAAAQLGYGGPSPAESWKFREPGASLPEGDDARGIEVDFSGRSLSWQYIQWKWDEASSRYLRSQFGVAHVDAVSGSQLAFATVVVMTADARVVDSDGHVVLEQYGEGPATVFTGGRAYVGTWKKADRLGRTRFFNESGDEIVFERGPIFIEVIGRQSQFSFKADSAYLPAMPTYAPPPPGSAPTVPDEEETPTAEATATTEPPATQTPGGPGTTPTPGGPATTATPATPGSTPTPGSGGSTPTPGAPATTPTPVPEPTTPAPEPTAAASPAP